MPCESVVEPMPQKGRLIAPTVVVLSVLLFLGWLNATDHRVFLIGDSTMADKPLVGNPERGWGQMFPLFLQDGVIVENHARNGRSTKSFIREGRWDSVYTKLRPGDYVLMQFGHNDAKKEDSTRYAEAHTDYKANLLRFVRDARAKEAIPILITPVCRRRFDDKGKFYDVHGDYPAVVRELAVQENVPLVDLNRMSFELFDKLGQDGTERLFLRAEPGLFSAIPQGKKDDTHFNSVGAEEVAKLVVAGLKELDIPLAKFLKSGVSFEGNEKMVLLDNFYNNEWRKDPTGNPLRYHYVWHDTTNSGFSILGKLMTNSGAYIDTLCQAPTAENLKRASIYVIVDPDTPKETESPNFVDGQAIDAITDWVHAGGVLMLMGNDKGNAEFEHFNRLAEQFGVHFNEDNRNRVVGKDFGTGTFDSFPDHPLFNGVKKIYVKELSTLQLQAPATAIFTEGGETIMAFAKIGKGAVFAVGDPWFYNEYMDNRKLPDGYDNARAAENLFGWLLQQSSKH
jgi:lysophospholipase L1-like esterase